MRIAGALIAVVLLLPGCVKLTDKDGGIFYRYGQEQKLDRAIAELGQGHTDNAVALLTEVSKEKVLPGVTDQALFRLGILDLSTDEDEDDGLQESQKHLKRLKREFPASPWTAQGAPLLDLVTAVIEERRQNKAVKGQLQNLQKENRELRHRFDLFKNIDIQLEKKSKP